MRAQDYSRPPRLTLGVIGVIAVVIPILIGTFLVTGFARSACYGEGHCGTPPAAATGASSPGGQQARSSAYTVKVANSTKYGSYLVNGSGFTLYYFAPDTVGNATSPAVSKCNTAEACISVWPAFYVSKEVVPPSLNASNFTTITRTDGSPQLAYKGHPLYLYIGDTSAGAVTGNDIDINGGYWYVASVNGSLG